MKVTEFRENFEIDRTAKIPRARQKNGAKELPEATTADGAIFDPNQRYFFFDQSGREVRRTLGLRRIDCDYLGSFGLKIVKISELRSSRDDALADGQDFFRNRISELNKLIAEFEAQKDV